MSQKIEVLEDNSLNEMKESYNSFNILKCDNCDYTASTSNVLKRHKTSKHKVKDVSKEKEGGGKIENTVNPSKSLDKQSKKVGMTNWDGVLDPT